MLTNDPDRYVDEIIEKVLTTYSEDKTLTTSLQDWRKGHRAEIDEVNGWVVDMLEEHGQRAPLNNCIVKITLDIEAGRLNAKAANLALLVDAVNSSAQCA